MMSGRKYIIVDVATTGFDPVKHLPVEIAWCYPDHRDPSVFRLPHAELNDNNRQHGALDVIGYTERGLGDPSTWDTTGEQLRTFHNALAGNTMVTWDAAFDAAVLTRLFDTWKHLFHGWELPNKPWYSVVGLATYALGARGESPRQSISLGTMCSELNVKLEGWPALGDVRAVRECLIKLYPRSEHRAAGVAVPES